MAELRIYEPIGYVTAAGVAQELDRLGPGPLDVRINSTGGSVYEGVGIHNVLARHSGPTTVYIDGVAASAASFIAMAGDEIVISPYGRMMIHDAWTLAIGNAGELRRASAELDQLSAIISQMYADRAGGDTAAWRATMLAGETWYTAEEAVAAGLADRIGEIPTAGRGADPPDLALTVAVAAARRRRTARKAG